MDADTERQSDLRPMRGALELLREFAYAEPKDWPDIACDARFALPRLERDAAPPAAPEREPLPVDRPKIVCLCGSTRFKVAYDEANYRETMAGNIVLSVGFFMHASGNRHGQDVGATPQQKIALDDLHLRKIDLADEVLVLNMGGYIGDSTRREIAYAKAHGKPVRYLESAAERAPVAPPPEEGKP